MDDSTNFLEKNKLTALAYIEGIGTQDLQGISEFLHTDATFWQIGKNSNSQALTTWPRLRHWH